MAKNKSRWIPIDFCDLYNRYINGELKDPSGVDIIEAWKNLPYSEKNLRPHICDGKVFFAAPRSDYYRNMQNWEFE